MKGGRTNAKQHLFFYADADLEFIGYFVNSVLIILFFSLIWYRAILLWKMTVY